MTINLSETSKLTPRDELVQNIMIMLDDAMTNSAQVSAHELAERVVSMAEGVIRVQFATALQAAMKRSFTKLTA
jgi:hypothetical protein